MVLPPDVSRVVLGICLPLDELMQLIQIFIPPQNHLYRCSGAALAALSTMGQMRPYRQSIPHTQQCGIVLQQERG